MKTKGLQFRISTIALAMVAITSDRLVQPAVHAASAALVGWTERGVTEHADIDFSIFSLHAPGTTVRAQFMRNGLLVTNDADVVISYEAVADSSGSLNSTSVGKGNFYEYAEALLGVTLAPDEGTAGFGMPGLANEPQTMRFDPAQDWFVAERIPITPIDDQGRQNLSPMMRLVARNRAGTLLATTDIALPLSSNGMNCRNCHASGAQTVARPNGGWTWDADPERDFKLNILQKHDDRHLGSEVYSNALQEAGYDNAGLVASARQGTKPVLCVRCHTSNAQPGSGVTGMRSLTQLMHTKHSYVDDPKRGLPLSLFNDSATCLNCHAGPESRYLRGAHRNAVNTDGTAAIQCQSCHGNMLAVGREGRVGWNDQPNCQSCHTGTATQNSGQIRYLSAFDAAGQERLAANQTFATQASDPASGMSSFSHSEGHGGMKCTACHGPAHGEWPSNDPNENAQSQRLQGNAGTVTRCTACHVTTPSTANGGPHGMHSVSQQWVSNHDNNNTAQCRTCHGSNSRGTVLSKAHTDNTFTGRGTHHFWPGFQTSCYNCHNGPGSDNQNANRPPTVTTLSANTTAGSTVDVPLTATDPDGSALALRIISQPVHGRVSLSSRVATYFPEDGYIGPDSFTYAANDTQTDSSLGQVNVTVNPGDCVLTAFPAVPRAALPNSIVPFFANVTLSGCQEPIKYDWYFADGSPHSKLANSVHTYAAEGNYRWKLTVRAGGVTNIIRGDLTISSTLGPPLALSIENWFFQMNLSWPWDPIPTVLETTTEPSNPYSWLPVYDIPFLDPFTMSQSVQVFNLSDRQFFRLRRVP